MVKWLEGRNSTDDIVISSRIRLARNLEDIKFPHMLNTQEGQGIIDKVKNAILDSNTVLSRDFNFYRLREMLQTDSKAFIEKHLISPALMEKPEISGFLLRKDEKVTIMINEEDHIRLQVILPGLNLEDALDLGNKIDDILEENLVYAFDEKLGYLTTCPTNVGTGLRASVMVHLPCLVLNGYINKVLQAVTQIGLTVRGLYGEGTSAMGNIFQISNQTTLGESEEEIIQKLKKVVLQIVQKERNAKENLVKNKKIEVEDKVYRSLGVLKNARIISSKEAMKLLSDVRMGMEMGILKDGDASIIDKLMIITQPANIAKYFGKDLAPQERDIKRAKLIRERL